MPEKRSAGRLNWALDTESPEIVINESQKKNTTEFVNDLMKAMQDHLTGEKAKYTVADFIRLAEFKKQIEHEEVKEVVVRWVETTEEPSSAR